MKHIVFFSCLALFNVCNAQLPDYYVYLVKGAVTLSKLNGKPQAVKQGDFVFNADIVGIAKNSEITLVNRNTEYFVLNTAGIVKVSSIPKTLSKSYTGVTKKYLNLVWEQVLDPNYDFKKFKNKNLTGVYGGVSRGESCGNLIFPINGLTTSRDSIQFKWHQTSPSSSYTFFIYDGEGKEAVNMPIKDTQLFINASRFSAFKAGKYYWLVKSDDATCEDEVPIYFELMTKNDEEKLIASLVVPSTIDDLQNTFQIIETLEKKALIYVAADYYENLIKSNPGDDALLKSYVVFLLKYGFDEKATALWDAGKR